MENIRAIKKDIYWVGGGDRRMALFENLFPLDDGVTYNAFLIQDEKTALLDTADSSILQQFLTNVEAALAGRALDYLVVSHMEPDHCAAIAEICRLYPMVKIVGNAKTFQLIGQFFDMDLSGRTLEVKERETLCLGKHTLQFFMAPMVHWPEVIFTYESSEGILFTADALGTFGGYNGNLFSDETDYEEMYMRDARQYYTNVVGKFGVQVQAILKKVASLEIALICPLHGPMLRGGDIPLMLEKYQRWSSYTPEIAGVLIPYGSIYGHTEEAAHYLAGLLAEKGVRHMELFDVSKTHYSWIIAQAFRFSHMVWAAPTYNMGLFAPMEHLLRDMQALNLQRRKVAIIGNGSWAPQSAKLMQELLGGMKDMQLLGQPVVIHSAMKPDQAAELEALAETIAASVQAEDLGQ